MTVGQTTAQERVPHVRISRGRIATNFLSMASTSVLGLVVTILISVYVRRVLGPSAIGQVSWAMAVVLYLTAVVTPGLATVGQRELALAPERGQSLLALVLTLQTLLALVAYALLAIVALLEPRGATVSLLLLIQGVTVFSIAWNTTWVLQAQERMVAPSLAALAFNAAQLPALMLLIDSPDDLILYAVLTLPFAFATVAFNVWYLSHRKVVRLAGLRPTLRGARALFREAWPLALAQVAILLIANTGTVVLGFTDGDDAVGQFYSAFRLMMVAGLVTAALWNAYFPSFARSREHPEQAVALSREYLGLLAWMGLPLAAVGWALGRHVVELLYGPAFAPAGHYFEWLCLTIGLTFVNYGVAATLVPWGRGDLQLRITSAAALLNIVVCLAAAPLVGPWGAVAASIASEFLVVMMGIALRYRLKIFWHPVLPLIAAPLLCSVAVAVVLVALPRSLDHLWFVQLAAAGLVIAACMVACEWRTLRRLRQMLQR
ncbi:oligosaccharide flippase family protein [Reyranella sp.]|uniref:oligosaccharide flippase family protein n=1 Tax=Reyranella sp. TaxID=1929291 RepID=UPI003D0BCC88